MIEHIDNRLTSWARWKLFAYQGGGLSPYPAYRQMEVNYAAGWERPGAPPPYVPIENLECAATDLAVCALQPILKGTVVIFYCGRGTVAQKMRDLHIKSTQTLYARLHESHTDIMGSLNDLAAGLIVQPWTEPIAKKA